MNPFFRYLNPLSKRVNPYGKNFEPITLSNEPILKLYQNWLSYTQKRKSHSRFPFLFCRRQSREYANYCRFTREIRALCQMLWYRGNKKVK